MTAAWLVRCSTRTGCPCDMASRTSMSGNAPSENWSKPHPRTHSPSGAARQACSTFWYSSCMVDMVCLRRSTWLRLAPNREKCMCTSLNPGHAYLPCKSTCSLASRPSISSSTPMILPSKIPIRFAYGCCGSMVWILPFSMMASSLIIVLSPQAAVRAAPCSHNERLPASRSGSCEAGRRSQVSAQLSFML